MFRRSRKAGRAVSFDHWFGSPEARDCRLALEAGDVAPLSGVYARADGHLREVLIDRVTLDRPPLPIVEAWPEREPDSAVAFLTRGSQRISAAWDARGHGYAETVGERSWEVFFDCLRRAEADLMQASALDDDGVAWSRLLISGRGLQLHVEELKSRYLRATRATPALAFAADQLLQCLCAKWSGTHDEMFEFARQVGGEADAGDPRHRLLPMAHFERAIEFRDDERGRKEYRDSADVRDEILAAAEKSVLRPDFGVTPQHVLTLNCFALALCYFQCFDVARPLMERIGDGPTEWPWNSFNDGSSVFLDYRRQVGVG